MAVSGCKNNGLALEEELHIDISTKDYKSIHLSKINTICNIVFFESHPTSFICLCQTARHFLQEGFYLYFIQYKSKIIPVEFGLATDSLLHKTHENLNHVIETVYISNETTWINRRYLLDSPEVLPLERFSESSLLHNSIMNKDIDELETFLKKEIPHDITDLEIICAPQIHTSIVFRFSLAAYNIGVTNIFIYIQPVLEFPCSIR
jgi:hypothetical protein